MWFVGVSVVGLLFCELIYCIVGWCFNLMEDVIMLECKIVECVCVDKCYGKVVLI